MAFAVGKLLRCSWSLSSSLSAAYPLSCFLSLLVSKSSRGCPSASTSTYRIPWLRRDLSRLWWLSVRSPPFSRSLRVCLLPTPTSKSGILLKSSLVFVTERPRKAARADYAWKLPPRACFELGSFDGDSNKVLNFKILSSRSLTCKSPESSINCCFWRSIYSSLCSFYSSSSFWSSSISSSCVSNFSSKSLMM